MCKGSDILKVAAVAAAVYTGGASAGLWGAAEGAAAVGAGEVAAGGMSTIDLATGAVASSTAAAQAGLAPEYMAALSSAAGAGTVLANGTQAAVAPAGEAAAGGSSINGASIMGALKTGAQLAPLASLAMMVGGQPKMEAQGIPGPTAPPASQAAQTPAPNIFKKKLSALGDPTKASGVGGVADVSLGKATVLGQ